MEDICENRKLFQKAKLLREKKERTSSLGDTLGINLTGRDFLDSNSTSYNEGSLVYLQLHKQAAELVTRTQLVAVM